MLLYVNVAKDFMKAKVNVLLVIIIVLNVTDLFVLLVKVVEFPLKLVQNV